MNELTNYKIRLKKIFNQKENMKENLGYTCDRSRYTNIWIMGVPEREKKMKQGRRNFEEKI